MKRLLPLILCLVPFLLHAQLRHDTSFGDNGYAVINWATTGIAQMHGQLQSDGKIIVSGNRIREIRHEGYVLRLHADGSLDTSYGTNGSYISTFSGGDDGNGPDIYLLPDNSLICFLDDFTSSLFKLTPQGTVDYNFVQNAGYSNFVAQDFTSINPQREQLYFMTTTSQVSGLQRIDTHTGMLDTTYGNALHTVPVPIRMDSDSEIVMQTEGSFVYFGKHYNHPNDPNDRQCYLQRALADGSPDLSFGTNGSTRIFGMPETSFDDFSSFEQRIVCDASGSFYIVAHNWENFNSTIYKFDANGLPATTFGNNGKIVMPDKHFVMDLYIHQDKLYLTGRKVLNNDSVFGDSDMMLAKYDLSGQPDTNFAPDGIYIEDGNDFRESGEDLIFTDDGAILVIGEIYRNDFYQPYVARYTEQLLLLQQFAKKAISYQNPVDDLLSIHGAAVSGISLFGTDGRLIDTATGNSVSTNGLSNGLFLARIAFDDGSSQTIKIIKR